MSSFKDVPRASPVVYTLWDKFVCWLAKSHLHDAYEYAALRQHERDLHREKHVLIEQTLMEANARIAEFKQAAEAQKEWQLIIARVLANTAETQDNMLKDQGFNSGWLDEEITKASLAAVVVRRIFKDLLKGRHVRFTKEFRHPDDEEYAMMHVTVDHGSWVSMYGPLSVYRR